MKKVLLVAMMALGLAASAVAAEDAPKEDQAIKQIDEMIAKADVNKDDTRWRTKLTKPEPAAFDAGASGDHTAPQFRHDSRDKRA